MLDTAPTPTAASCEPWTGTIDDLMAAIRDLPYGDHGWYDEIDAEIAREAEEREAAQWIADYRARRAEEEARAPRRIAGGTIPSTRTALTRLSRTAGARFIDHRGIVWTAVGPDNPGVWVNASGIYRDTITLATRIAREGK